MAQSRYELDVAPLSAFVDVTPEAGYHVRAGYQIITMGRFDVFSASNFLAVYDLRSGPVTMPEASAIAQPAIRYDLDRIRGFTLQAYYVPFFQPHLITVYGSDYALLSPFDRQQSTSTDAARQVLENALGRSGLSGTTTGAFQALAPAPNLAEPQGAIRATVYGSRGELSLTLGTALEHLPTLVESPQLQAFLANPRVLTDSEAAQLLDRPIRVEHHRFAVASLDGALDVGPVQLGAEVAYMAGRTLLGTRAAKDLPPGATPTSSDMALSVPERVNMAQGGLRAELVEAAGWAAELEAFAMVALRDPSDPSLRWFAMEHGRWLRGVAGGVHWAPERAHLRLELGAAVVSGPSYVLLPHAEWEAIDAFYLELGAAIIDGPVRGPLGAPNVTPGGLFNDIDQVFMGVRWTP